MSRHSTAAARVSDEGAPEISKARWGAPHLDILCRPGGSRDAAVREDLGQRVGGAIARARIDGFPMRNGDDRAVAFCDGIDARLELLILTINAGFVGGHARPVCQRCETGFFEFFEVEYPEP